MSLNADKCAISSHCNDKHNIEGSIKRSLAISHRWCSLFRVDGPYQIGCYKTAKRAMQLNVYNIYITLNLFACTFESRHTICPKINHLNVSGFAQRLKNARIAKFDRIEPFVLFFSLLYGWKNRIKSNDGSGDGAGCAIKQDLNHKLSNSIEKNDSTRTRGHRPRHTHTLQTSTIP